VYLEERVNLLEKENRLLKEKVSQLEQYSMTKFVSVKELAEMMGCSVQNIHRKIKTGEIQVTRKLGDPRIPMCQFMDGLEQPELVVEKTPPKPLSMAEQIFGK
jgi:predicted transcriptional regulator